MKITRVEPQKKHARRFNIYLDGEFIFGADEDLVVNRRLVVGKIIEQDDLEKLLFEAEVGKLMEKMYRLFSIRQRSEKEIRDYFRMKQVSDLGIEKLIEKLKQKQMINDEQFAKFWIEARRRSKKLGIKALKQELFQKGIDREIIEQVTRNKEQGTSEEELASQALERKLNSWKDLPALEFKKKTFGYLGRKGFEFEVIKKVVENFLKKE